MKVKIQPYRPFVRPSRWADVNTQTPTRTIIDTHSFYFTEVSSGQAVKVGVIANRQRLEATELEDIKIVERRSQKKQKQRDPRNRLGDKIRLYREGYKWGGQLTRHWTKREDYDLSLRDTSINANTNVKKTSICTSHLHSRG